MKYGTHNEIVPYIACAVTSNCEYFLTTDDHVLKRTSLFNDININDPIGFIKAMELRWRSAEQNAAGEK